MASDVSSLTRAIGRGDDHAFATLYATWFDWSVLTTRRLTGRDESFCLDVVQDAMLKVARSIPTLQTQSDLQRWLLRVLHTVAIDHIRAETRRRSRESKAATPDQHTGIDAADSRDLLARLQQQLDSLPAPDRGLLFLRFLHGRSFEQTGDASGISAGAAHGRIRRLKARLAIALGGSPNDQ